MNKQAAVREFMVKAGQHVPAYINEPDNNIRRLRVKLIAEELTELAAASCVSIDVRLVGAEGTVERMRSDDKAAPISAYQAQVDAADALADLLYVTYGAAVAWGIDIDRVFAEVHRSNMTKFVDGQRRSDGKWIKGPSYEPANIAAVLRSPD